MACFMLANLDPTHQPIEVLFSLFHDKLISLFPFPSLPLSLSLAPLFTTLLSSSSFSLGPFFFSSLVQDLQVTFFFCLFFFN